MKRWRILVVLAVASTILGTGSAGAAIFSDGFDDGVVGWENGVQKWSEVKPSGWTFQENYGRWQSWGHAGGTNKQAGLVTLQTFTLGSTPLTIDTTMWKYGGGGNAKSYGGNVLLALMQSNSALTAGDLTLRIDRWSEFASLATWNSANNYTDLWSSNPDSLAGATMRFVLDMDANNYTLYTSDRWDDNSDGDLSELVERSSGTHGLGYSTFYIGTIQEQTAYNGAGANWDYVTVVPEPATMLLLGSGLLGAMGLLRKRRA